MMATNFCASYPGGRISTKFNQNCGTLKLTYRLSVGVSQLHSFMDVRFHSSQWGLRRGNGWDFWNLYRFIIVSHLNPKVRESQNPEVSSNAPPYIETFGILELSTYIFGMDFPEKI